MSIGQFAIIKLVMFMNRLRELRKERGFTQIKMQMLTGIDQSDYSKLETGKRYYTFEQLKKLALALDTSMDYLAGLTDEKKFGNINTSASPSIGDTMPLMLPLVFSQEVFTSSGPSMMTLPNSPASASSTIFT